MLHTTPPAVSEQDTTDPATSAVCTCEAIGLPHIFTTGLCWE